MLKKVVTVLIAFLISCTCAAENLTPLPADKAFAFSAYLAKDNQLILEWKIAPGYYLYRSQLKLTPTSFNHVQIDKVSLPQGLSRHDVLHGNYQAYSGSLKIPLTLIGPHKGVLNLDIDYQGCSTDGFCYTPIKKALKINLATVTIPQSLDQYVQSVNATTPQSEADENGVLKFFKGGNLLTMMLGFLGLGLLLAFTPCVLPMVPILSGIIIGQGKKTGKKKSFLLSAAYVGGMALTYAVAGMVVALIGSSIQAQLQQPWIIVLFSGLFVLLALSLFGFYEVRLPARFQRQVTALSNKQGAGNYFGVFLMGCLSTLIVSPCVSAPLVGVLAYIGQTGHVLLGGLALLALGVGMGIPLLLMGISADRLLPKAGSWMNAVEKVFGFIMLGLAVWMLSRIIPGPLTLLLWAAWLIAFAIFLLMFFPVRRLRWLRRGIAIAGFIYAAILIGGAAEGRSDIFYLWAQFDNSRQQAEVKKLFKVITSMNELHQQLTQAKNARRPVLLDFYADWCSSCVLMERTVFAKEKVQQALADVTLLRVNLTANTEFDQAISQYFHVVGPPSVVFFDSQGRELTTLRIVGEVTAEEFLARLGKL